MKTIGLVKQHIQTCIGMLESECPNNQLAAILGEVVSETSECMNYLGNMHYREPLTQHKDLLDQLLADIYNVDVTLSRDQIAQRLSACLQLIQQCLHLDSIQCCSQYQGVRLTGVEATEIWALLDNIACEQSGMSGFSRAADKYAGILKAKLGIEDATIE